MSQDKTAFVLAGGGSLGAIQVGMLRELVTNGIKPDFIVGSSVGALNGAYFACDPTVAGVERLASIWCGLKRQEVFPLTWRDVVRVFSAPASLVNPSGLRRIVEHHLPYRDLERAAIPVHVMATDLLTGASVNLSSGIAVDAVMASCAIPAAFPAVRIGQTDLIDGAIASNTPIVTAVKLGASRVIVLPTGYACALEAPPSTMLANALHAMNLLIAHQLVRDLELLAGHVEVITVPPLCPLATSPYDFTQARALIERAAEATGHWLDAGGMNSQRIPRALRPHVD